MGRIKTQMVKRLTFKLVAKSREKFNTNFDDNKKVVSESITGAGKKIRNTIAGYVTRLMRHKEDF